MSSIVSHQVDTFHGKNGKKSLIFDRVYVVFLFKYLNERRDSRRQVTRSQLSSSGDDFDCVIISIMKLEEEEN